MLEDRRGRRHRWSWDCSMAGSRTPALSLLGWALPCGSRRLVRWRRWYSRWPGAALRRRLPIVKLSTDVWLARTSESPPQSCLCTQGRCHVRRSAEFKISIASGSPTSLISATPRPAVGVQHQLAGIGRPGDRRRAATARMVSGAPSASLRTKALQNRHRPEPGGTRHGPRSLSRRHIHSSTSSGRDCREVCGESPTRRTSSWWMKNSVVFTPSSTPGITKMENRPATPRTRSTSSG